MSGPMNPTVPFENQILWDQWNTLQVRIYFICLWGTMIIEWKKPSWQAPCYISLGVRKSEDGAISLIPQLIPDQMPLGTPEVANLILQNIKCAFPMGRSYSKQMKYISPLVLYFTVLKFRQCWSNVVHFD